MEMDGQAQVLLFGDLSLIQFREPLRLLLHVKNNPLLTSFFDRVNYSLRRLVEVLPDEHQDLFPRFTTLIDLVSRLGNTDGTSVLGFFLLSVYEVAQSIVYFTEESRTLPPQSGTRTYVIGPCTGGFAAAAFSCSNTLPDLVSNGLKAVLTAFKTAFKSYLVGQSLSSRTTHRNKSWSVVLSPQGDVAVQQTLDEYKQSKAPLRDGALWVSAVTVSKATTLSGRPFALQDFVTSNASKLKARYLDIESPYHAAHLFNTADIDEICSHIADTDAELTSVRQVPRLPLLSSSTGEVIAAPDFNSLLRTVVEEALQAPIRWDLVLKSCRAIFQQKQINECLILPFSSNAASMVSTSLVKDGSLKISIHDVSSSQAGGNILPPGPTGRFEHSKIAIVGYSGRFPSADSNEAFWDLLKAGRDVHKEIPPDRFDWKAHYDPTGKKKNTSRVKYGCFIDEPGLFDTKFFNMSPREAEHADPGQRLAITTAYEAMEMAGMVRNRTPSTQQDRVGVFFGTTSDDWREVNSGQDVGTYFIPGGNRAFVPGRMSYFFRFSGPSLSIDTACSSSFAAIQAACSYLWRAECDTAIAGGTNVLTNPDNFAGLDRGHFLSTTGNCNTFDDEASGYCRSDAVGSVVLKRLEDAEADNDPIFGVIVGTNTNHCGQTDSITRPHEGDQTSVFKRVMRHANVDPLDISYIEMHGTGTQAGDATEMNSVLSTFVPEYKRTQIQPARPLFIGSAKANIGHAESSSGVSSLIKVLMMMKHNEIPRHCGIKTRINHNYPLDLTQRGVNIAMETTPWRRQDSASGKRASFLNNFSAAGGNTAMLVEDAPTPRLITETDPRPFHVITISAKTPKSLLGNINALTSYMEKRGSSILLAALSYTTTARRMHHNYRAVVSGSDHGSIISALKSRAAETQDELADLKPIPAVMKKKARVVFMFSGQGTLYAELGRSLFDTNSAFRTSIHKLNRLAEIHGFPSFLGLVDGTVTADDLPQVGAVVSQLALVCVQIALLELWKSWGVTPAAVVGHSLGEYATLYAAEVLSLADVIYLAGTRAALLEARCTPGSHSMLAVKASLEVVNQLIHQTSQGTGCELACANQPSGHVISGPGNKIADVARAAADAGVETVRLNVAFAFHSAQVEPILTEFKQAASQGVAYHPPTVPVLSPLLGKIVPAGEHNTFNGTYLTAACRGKVDFMGALAAAASAPADDGGLGFGAAERTVWLDIGAHPACAGMVKGTLGSQSRTIATLRQNVNAYKTLAASLEVMYLAGIEINWNEYHRHFPASHQVLDLPLYKWDLKNYWIQYKNDFCLTKGDNMIQQLAAEAPDLPTVVPKYISPCAQMIIEESHGAEHSSLVVESDIFDDRLLPVLQGHRVNGAALSPSSMYADLALTVANYMLLESPNKLSTATTGVEVNNVRVDNPLIALHTETTHLFRASAKADWSSNLISLQIYSVNSSGKRTTSHAKIDIQIAPQQRWVTEWKRNTHLITSRLDALDQSIRSDSSNTDAHLIKRGMAYKLFGALVNYAKEYQGMSEVILDSKRLEAVATVELQVGQEGFTVNPRWIDSLGMVAGFIMNANDGVDSRNQVFINHGWERMRVAEPISQDKVYRAYNRMQLVENTMYAGDTYILEGDRIVAIFEGVRFQGVPRRMLDHLLPNQAGSVTTKPTVPSNKSTVPTPASMTAPKPKASVPAPLPQPPKARSAAKASSGVLGRILAIISEEVGIEASELKPETDFADLGIDSLLSLTITSKIREELGLDFASSLFIDHPTVGELPIPAGDDEVDAGDISDSSSDSNSDADTPDTKFTSSATSIYQDSSDDEEPPSRRAQVVLVVRQAIAEETQVSIGELKPTTSLADIGIDSLLSLTIGARLQELLEVDLPGTMFVEHETLQDAEEAVCNVLGLRQPEIKKPSAPSKKPFVPSEPAPAPTKKPRFADTTDVQDSLAVTRSQPSSHSSLPQATSILLSGSPQTAQLILFLFPDGSGSASSYAAVSRVIDTTKVAVYGLNCPWRTTGSEMTRLGIDMAVMVSRYVVEVQRLIQQCQTTREPGRFPGPTPFIAFGGWSAGGILALEATRQLQQQTEAVKISQLILFDSPNPIGLQNPPQRMYDFFDSLGIFGSGPNKTPAWLRQHFDAFIRVLDAYEPSPLPHAPASMIVYARDGICKDPNGPRMETFADDPREMFWLLNNRTDFSAEGWASILEPKKLSIRVMDDVNHFTLMDPGSKMKEMGQIISEFLAKGSRAY